MEVDRRSLMKGMLASGALLALGLPSWAFANQSPQRPRQCTLILTGTSADEAFARGTQSACASIAYDRFVTHQLKGGVLTGTDEVAYLLAHASGGRIIAILDDASAVIFLELARPAGVRMLSMGTHACSIHGACHIRHELASSSQDHSAGGVLASQLIHQRSTFSITESFLHDTSPGLALTAWSAPGFCSYRSVEPEPIHLHCSGLSLPEGCRLLAWGNRQQWIPISPQVSDPDSTTSPSENWVESVGYAVAASALGMDSVKETCSGRAFVHQATESERIGPQERFMSFVMDL